MFLILGRGIMDSQWLVFSKTINFEKKALNDWQALLSAMALSIPVFIRELFTYLLPTALPILGWALGGFYLGLHTMLIAVKGFFIILMGRRSPARNLIEEKREMEKGKSLWEAIKKGLLDTLLPLKRMAITIPLVTFITFEMEGMGMFNYSIPVARSLGLPICALPVLVGYAASPLIGLSILSALYHQGGLLLGEALKVMLIALILNLPVMMVRYSGTYYIGVYGPRLGTKLALISSTLSVLVYGMGLLMISGIQIL